MIESMNFPSLFLLLCIPTSPCSSPGRPCCDQRRGRSPFTHNVVTVSLSLSDLSTVKENVSVFVLCVFAYSCCSATSSAAFYFSLFSRVAVFLPNICHLSPPSSFPLPSSLSQPSPRKNPYHWLPWDLVAMQRRGFRMVLVCVRVYRSVTESGCHVDWEEEEEEKCWVRMWGLETSCCHLVGPQTLDPDMNIQTLTHIHTP